MTRERRTQVLLELGEVLEHARAGVVRASRGAGDRSLEDVDRLLLVALGCLRLEVMRHVDAPRRSLQQKPRPTRRRRKRGA